MLSDWIPQSHAGQIPGPPIDGLLKSMPQILHLSMFVHPSFFASHHIMTKAAQMPRMISVPPIAQLAAPALLQAMMIGVLTT